MSKPRPSAPPSAGGNAAPTDQPTFRSNPEVDAKIDAYIKENPKYWAYVQAMPRERLERTVVLNEQTAKAWREAIAAEDIAQALDVSMPTAYRYLKTLSDAGLLRRGSDARYTLGPRVVVLDHLIRQADPVLQCGIPIMKELVARSLLSKIYQRIRDETDL